MMLSLSQSQPTVSAIALPLRRPHGLHHRLVDPLDEVVALLVQLVDGALRRGARVFVLDARLVLLVPELDVRLRELGDQTSDGVVHGILVKMRGAAAQAPGRLGGAASGRPPVIWAAARPRRDSPSPSRAAGSPGHIFAYLRKP